MSARSVIITGAAQGVGAACARRFAKAGDRLVLADENEELGRAFADDLQDAGATAAFVHADVAKRLDVHNIIAEALDAYDRVDVLIHAATLHFSAPFLETSEGDFDRIISANMRGAFLINQAAAKQFKKQANNSDEERRLSAIVNISSTEAVTAGADHVAFAASQGGVNQLTKAVAAAVSQYGVRANAVGLGAVNGELSSDADREKLADATPLKRIADPAEVAEVVYFLASPVSSFVTGQCVYVDGGRLAINVSESAEG
ncbi:MAG: SDR family oxidoreductase [Pseudomonadota bacterium]